MLTNKEAAAVLTTLCKLFTIHRGDGRSFTKTIYLTALVKAIVLLESTPD